jgi:hypothetical protein
MSRLLGHRLSAAMVFAMLALFMSLAGAGYAAIKLPAHSVGTKQIKAHAVVSSQIKNGSLRAQDLGARLVHRGAAAKTPAPPGVVFGGRTAQSWPIAIEVSKDARQVVRADVGLHLQCTAGMFINTSDDYRQLPLSTTGRFGTSFANNGADFGNGQRADITGSIKGKLNARRTSGTGTWSLKFVIHDATGAVVDTCDSGVKTWKVKQ